VTEPTSFFSRLSLTAFPFGLLEKKSFNIQQNEWVRREPTVENPPEKKEKKNKMK
jgi:hypothetical protein